VWWTPDFLALLLRNSAGGRAAETSFSVPAQATPAASRINAPTPAHSLIIDPLRIGGGGTAVVDMKTSQERCEGNRKQAMRPASSKERLNEPRRARRACGPACARGGWRRHARAHAFP